MGARRRDHGSLQDVLGIGCLAALLFSPACTAERPSPTAPSAGLGYVGGVTFHQALEIDGISPNRGVWDVPAGAPPGSAILSVDAQLGRSTCASAIRSCTDRTSAQVRLVVSADIDLSRELLLDGSRTVYSTLTAAGLRLRRSFTVPRLSRGEHCVMVTALENERDSIAAAAPHHGTVAVFRLRSGSSTPNHCIGEQPNTATSVVHGDSEGQCGNPVLSDTPHRLLVARRTTTATPLWLFIPVCGGSASAVLVHDGVPLIRGSHYPPVRVSRTGRGYVLLPLGPLPPGGWEAVTFQHDEHLATSRGLPLLVGD